MAGRETEAKSLMHADVPTKSVRDREDWVDHPRVPITRRAIFAGIAVIVLAVIAALVSVYTRRTRLEKTTEFWGPDTILALQYSQKVTLFLEPPVAAEAAEHGETVFERVVDLTGMPGMGHLRHALLDERHYEWETLTDEPVDAIRAAEVQFATLIFADAEGNFPTARIRLELVEGWAGPEDADRRVRMTDRARPAVRHFLTVVSSAMQDHYDRRR